MVMTTVRVGRALIRAVNLWQSGALSSGGQPALERSFATPGDTVCNSFVPSSPVFCPP